MKLPNDQLEQLELVEHLAVEMQHSNAGPLHAGPRSQAEVQAVLERTLADRQAASQLRAGDGRKSIPAIEHRVPTTDGRGSFRGVGHQAPLDLRAG